MNERKLHNEELHNSYSSPNIIRMLESWREDEFGKAYIMHRGGGGEKRFDVSDCG
jgi:hypothetical protein